VDLQRVVSNLVEIRDAGMDEGVDADVAERLEHADQERDATVVDPVHRPRHLRVVPGPVPDRGIVARTEIHLVDP